MNPHVSSDGVWFPNWAVVLAKVKLKALDRGAYRLAIIGYLSFCKRSRQRATVASARLFMAEVEAQRRLSRAQLALWKDGVNWFFKAAPAGEKLKSEMVKAESPLTSGLSPEGARKGAAGTPHPGPLPVGSAGAERGNSVQPSARGKEPPLAAADLGGPEWERELIRVLRERHYEWRTEQAYRMWARRFAGWLEGRGITVSQAGELELSGFLSDLAVRQRVAVATQRQALNALVFLMREALGKTLADFGGFDQARPGKRLPVVLSKAECQRLMEALEATPRLMAQLMYGSGVRLMELLRLRIHPVR